MAFKSALFLIKVLVTVFVILQDVPITSANVDCEGKSFYCVDSTNFKICVDFGNGISSTIDDLVVTCPEGTVCNNNNSFECEISIPTTQSANLLLSEAVANDERNLRSNESSQIPMDNISPSTFVDTSVTEIISPAKKNNESILQEVKSDVITERVVVNSQLTNNEDQKKSGTSESAIISGNTFAHQEDLPVETPTSHSIKNNAVVDYIKNVTDNRVKTEVDVINPKVFASSETNYLAVLGSENTTISKEFIPDSHSLYEKNIGNRTTTSELLRQNNSEVIIQKSANDNSLAAKLPNQNYDVVTQSNAGANAKPAQINEEIKHNVTSREIKEANIIIQKGQTQISVNDTMVHEKSEISANNTNYPVNTKPFNANKNESNTFVGTTESLNDTIIVSNSTLAPILLPSDKNIDENIFPVNLHSVTENISMSYQNLSERDVLHPVNTPDVSNSKISYTESAKLDNNTQRTHDSAGVKQAQETIEKPPREVTTDSTLEGNTVSISRLSNSVGKAEVKPTSADTVSTDKNTSSLGNLEESNNTNVEQILLDKNGTNDREQNTGSNLPETSTKSNIAVFLTSDEILTTTQKTITFMKENNINTTIESIIVPITENPKNYKSVPETEQKKTSSVTALNKEENIDKQVSTSVNADIAHNIIGSVDNNIKISNTNESIEKQLFFEDKLDIGINSDASANVTKSLSEPSEIVVNFPNLNTQKQIIDVVQNATAYTNKDIMESNQKNTTVSYLGIDEREVSIIDLEDTIKLDSLPPVFLKDTSLNTRNETNFKITTQNNTNKIDHIENGNASTGSALTDYSSLSKFKFPQNDTILSTIQTKNTQYSGLTQGQLNIEREQPTVILVETILQDIVTDNNKVSPKTEARNEHNKAPVPVQTNTSKGNATTSINNTYNSQDSAQRKADNFSTTEAFIIQPILANTNTELASKKQDVLSTTESTNLEYFAPTLEKTQTINNSSKNLQSTVLRKDFLLFTTQDSEVPNSTLTEGPIKKEKEQVTYNLVDSTIQNLAPEEDQFLSTIEATTKTYYSESMQGNTKPVNGHVKTISVDSFSNNNYSLQNSPFKNDEGLSTTTIQAIITQNSETTPEEQNMKKGAETTVNIYSINYNTTKDLTSKNIEVLSANKAFNTQNTVLAEKTELASINLANTALRNSSLKNEDVLPTITITQYPAITPAKISKSEDHNTTDAITIINNDTLQDSNPRNLEVLFTNHALNTQNNMLAPRKAELEKEQDTVILVNSSKPTTKPEQINNKGDTEITAVDTTTVISMGGSLQDSDIHNDKVLQISETKYVKNVLPKKHYNASEHGNIVSSDANRNIPNLAIKNDMNTQYLDTTIKANVERNQATSISVDSISQVSALKTNELLSNTQATVIHDSATTPENNDTLSRHAKAVSIESSNSIYTSIDRTTQAPNIHTSTTIPGKIQNNGHTKITDIPDTTTVTHDLNSKKDDVFSTSATPTSKYSAKINKLNEDTSTSVDSVNKYNHLKYTAIKHDEALSVTEAQNNQNSALDTLQDSDLNDGKVLLTHEVMNVQNSLPEKLNTTSRNGITVSIGSNKNINALPGLTTNNDDILSATNTLDTQYLAPTLEKPNLEGDQAMNISGDNVLLTSAFKKDGVMSTTEAIVTQYWAPALENNKTGNGYAKAGSVDSVNNNIYTSIIGAIEAPNVNNLTISQAINNNERTKIMPEDPLLKKDNFLSTQSSAKINTLNEYATNLSVDSINNNNHSLQDAVIKHNEVLFVIQPRVTQNSTLQILHSNNEKVLLTTTQNKVVNNSGGNRESNKNINSPSGLPTKFDKFLTANKTLETPYLAPTLETAKLESYQDPTTVSINSISHSSPSKKDEVFSTTEATVIQYSISPPENKNTKNGYAQTVAIHSVINNIYTSVDNTLKATVLKNDNILSTTESLSNSAPIAKAKIESVLLGSKNDEALMTTEYVIIQSEQEKNMTANEHPATIPIDSFNNNIYTLQESAIKTDEFLSATIGKTNSENRNATTETKKTNINAIVKNSNKLAEPKVIKINSNNGHDNGNQIQKLIIHPTPIKNNDNEAKITSIEGNSEKQTENKTDYIPSNNNLKKILRNKISDKSQSINNTVIRVTSGTKQKSTTEPQISSQNTSTTQINRENNKMTPVYEIKERNRSVESLLDSIKKLIREQGPDKSKNQANIFEYLMRYINNDGTLVKHNSTRLENIKHSALNQPSLPQLNKHEQVNYTVTNTIKSYSNSRIELDIKGVISSKNLTKINIDNHAKTGKPIQPNKTTFNMPSEQYSTIPENYKKLTQSTNAEQNIHENYRKIERTESEKHKQRSENNSTTICKGHRRGRYSDMHDCRKFYVCVGSHKYITGYCPNNTVFSELRKQCTKNLSHCVRGGEFHCVASGRYIDYEHENIYYICANNSLGVFVRFKLQCQGGYYLDRNTVKCTRQPPKYSIKLESYSEPEGKSSSDTDIESPESEECTKEGKFPEPGDCRRYYECHKTKKSKFRKRNKKCDKDEIFHKGKKKCVDAESYECESEGKG